MPDPLIEARDIDVRFGNREALNKATVTVRPGEIVTLIGPNGAGKTTLVRVVLGLQDHEGGTVHRRKGLRFGYMPQRLALDPALPITTGRFLSLAVASGGDRSRKRLEAALDAVGAGHVLNTALQQVSGGEMQRIILARTLLRDPELLVLDEPVQGVDVVGQAELYGLIARIRNERGCGVLMVSHDLHLVMAATDHVVCLNKHVCCAGHPEAVTGDPAYAALFGEHAARAVAVYQHHHDHLHDAEGHIVPISEGEGGRE